VSWAMPSSAAVVAVGRREHSRSNAQLLGVGETAVRRVARAAEEQVERDASLPRLVTLLDERCSPDLKRKVVHCLWRIAFADAELAVHEEYLVRKISESLQLTRADLVEAKIRAREESLEEG
jgi:uncharacterized tellurite resistance protein B-like protein